MEGQVLATGLYIPKRYVLAILGNLGFAVVYALRVNLSVALVSMVNSTYTHAGSTVTKIDPDCKKDHSDYGNNGRSVQDGEFNWDQETQGLILGSFFYGYLFTQIPGGMLAEKFGGKWVFGLGILGTALLTLLTPWAARTGVEMLVALRVLEGFGEAVTYPAMNALFSQWAPPLERSRMYAISNAGSSLGTILSMPVTGLLCVSRYGWPSVFYVFGGIGVLWFFCWALCTSSYPGNHPSISREELNYISSRISHSKMSQSKKIKYPWRQICTSLAFWAILVAHFCNNWVFYSLIICLPTYFKEVLDFPIQQNGALSAIPYVFLFVVQLSTGYSADYLRSRGILTTKETRKICTAVGLTMPSVLLAAVSYIGCDQVDWAVAFMTLAVSSQGIAVGGFNVNHLDIAPKYAGLLLALTNTVATIPGCVSPAIVGYFTEDKPTRIQWQKVLFIASGISFFGALFYLIFGQGKEQSWNQEYDVLVDNTFSGPGEDCSPVNADGTMITPAV